jgi:phosphoesterase RecJ-like protein
MKAEFIQTKRLIDKAEKILLIAHRRPDGDTLGACIAFNIALSAQGKDIEMACIDEIPGRYDYLPLINEFKHEFNYKDYDALIVCDAGASYMTNYHEKYPDIFSGEVPVVNIDHHASNDNFGTINLVDSNAASTTMIIYQFFKFCEYKFNPRIATCLLTGLYNDTGSFMHQNTTAETLQIAGNLMGYGGKIRDVTTRLFKSTPVSTLKLWGKVLDNIKITKDGVAISVITDNDFNQCGAEHDELSGAIDFINCIPGTKFTVLLNEDGKGNVKGSFRTRNEEVDLEEIAAKFGGGGHKKAAGFTIPGKLEQEIRWKIVPYDRKTNLKALKAKLSKDKSTKNINTK